MTGYTKAEISHAAELAHLIAETPHGGQALDEEVELGSWMESALRTGQADALQKLLRQCGPAGSGPYCIVSGLMRSIASLFEAEDATRILFAIPIGLDSQDEAQLGPIECRQQIERELEDAKGLPFLSIRLNQYPTRRINIEQLAPQEIGQVGQDLVRYADSKKLPPPVIGPGADHLLWLGAFRFMGDSAQPLFDMTRGAQLQEWLGKATQWLSDELKTKGVSKVMLFPPFRLQHGLSVSRLYQLKTDWNTRKDEIAATTLSYQRAGGYLRWTLFNDKTCAQVAGEAWLPDESEETVLGSLRSFVRRTGLGLSREE